MSKKNIAIVGTSIPGCDDMHVPINSKSSLLDYDIIVFDPDITPFHGYYDEHYLGKVSLDDHGSFSLKEHLDHWKKEIFESIKVGKSIFILLNNIQEVYIATGNKTYSGTGRNQKTTRHVTLINNYNLIPGNISLREANGRSMKLVGNNNPITSYWSDLGAECEFRVLIDSKDATPLIMPRAGDSPVGASAKFKGGTGTLYLLPYLDFDKDSYAFEKDDSNFWTEEALQIGKRFISGIIEIEKNCRNNFKQTPPPTWLAENKTFSLPAETAISEKLLQLGTKIEALQTQKNSLLKNLDEEIVLKGLLYEKGFPLESAIIQALTLLGFNATNYHENDSEFDVVFDSPEGRLLGEAEGKDNRAINIDKLRQLEMNIHEDFSRDEIDEQAKGVLFGNAYRLLLPTERKDFFTAKCITAVSRSNTALVRTTDLYKVAQYLSAKSDKRFSKKCREAILNGVGLIIFPKMPIQKRKEPKVIIDSVD